MSAGLFKSPDILSDDPKKLYMNTASVPVYFQYRNVHFWHYRLNHGNFAMHFSLFSKSDIRALPVSNLSAAPVMHGCIPASGGL